MRRLRIFGEWMCRYLDTTVMFALHCEDGGSAIFSGYLICTYGFGYSDTGIEG